jgi:hypothetical protein
MIINIGKRKVIFIHIPKCGGISIETTIQKALHDGLISRNKLINKAPRENILYCRGLRLHSTLKDYKSYYEEDINNFYIFSFVRNPWRRLVSHYEYLVKNGYNSNCTEDDKLSFSDFIQVYDSNIVSYNIKSYDEYLSDNQTELNFVGKLENINEDMKKVGLDIKLDLTDVLHMNATDLSLREHEDWHDYYNPWTKKKVYEIFAKDIEKYDYEF